MASAMASSSLTATATASSAALARTVRVGERAAPAPGAPAVSSSLSATTSTVPASRLDEVDKDALRMAPEAQWILSVLDDVYSKLALIGYLTPEIMKDKIIDALDADIVIALRVHFQVEKQYESLLEVLRLGQVSAAAAAAAASAGGDPFASTAGLPNGGGAGGLAGAGATGAGFSAALGDLSDPEAAAESAANVEEQVAELELCISDSTRTVVRLLKQNPLLVRRLREIAHQHASASLSFSHVFSRLRTLARSTLCETADEERLVREQLAALQEQEEEERERFASLTDLLERNRGVYTQTLAAKDAHISDLRREIAAVVQRTAAERGSLDQNLRDSANAARDEYDAAERALATESTRLAQRLESEGGDRFRTEIQKQRQKDLRAADITAKIDAYDEAMSDKHRRLVELMQTYEKESRELKRLNVFFEQRDEETARVDQEIATITAARDAEVTVERLRNENSIFVHDLLGSYEDRKGKEEKLAAKIAQLKKDGKLKGTLQQQMQQFKELQKAAKKKKK